MQATRSRKDLEQDLMKLIALEEHFGTPEVNAAWADLPSSLRDGGVKLFNVGETERRLMDLSAHRLQDMDECGVDVQVLSLTTPAVQSLDASKALDLAQRSNNLPARVVSRNPDRFQGFAVLPTPTPGKQPASLSDVSPSWLKIAETLAKGIRDGKAHD